MDELTIAAAAAKYHVPEATLHAFAARGCSDQQRLMDPLSGMREGVMMVQDDARLAAIVEKIRAGRRLASMIESGATWS